MLNACAHVEQVGAADHVVKLLDAELRHDLTHFFGNEEEIVDDMLRFAGKLFAQLGVLRGHTHGAGVQVAFAHHDAAFNHQRCGGETEFIRAQQSTHGHIAAGFHLTIGLHADATAQTIQHQSLLGFSQTNFPRLPACLMDDQGDAPVPPS